VTEKEALAELLGPKSERLSFMQPAPDYVRHYGLLYDALAIRLRKKMSSTMCGPIIDLGDQKNHVIVIWGPDWGSRDLSWKEDHQEPPFLVSLVADYDNGGKRVADIKLYDIPDNPADERHVRLIAAAAVFLANRFVPDNSY
jgi:hypothetical protein